MAEIIAYAKTFRDWEGLIGACIHHAGMVPGVEPLRAELETVLTQLREAKVLQESLTASRQAMTQRLGEMVADGRELARKIRHFVRVPLGSRHELLSAFGVRPNRSKLRKTRPGEVLPAAAQLQFQAVLAKAAEALAPASLEVSKEEPAANPVAG